MTRYGIGEGTLLRFCSARVERPSSAAPGESNALGLANTSVLLMEFLEGTEFVVDTCSRDGAHKVTAIWRYEKRAFHGAPVVYCGMHLLSLANVSKLGLLLPHEEEGGGRSVYYLGWCGGPPGWASLPASIWSASAN